MKEYEDYLSNPTLANWKVFHTSRMPLYEQVLKENNTWVHSTKVNKKDVNTEYKENDVVKVCGYTYRATRDHTTSKTFYDDYENNHWELVRG